MAKLVGLIVCVALAGAAWFFLIPRGDSGGNPPPRTAETLVAPQPPSPGKSEETRLTGKAAEARDFIVAQTTRFESSSEEGVMPFRTWQEGKWDIEFQSLDSQWAWSGARTDFRLRFSGETVTFAFSGEDFNYTVDPEMIGLPAVVSDMDHGGASIKMECRSAKCISVSGRRVAVSPPAIKRGSPEHKGVINMLDELIAMQASSADRKMSLKGVVVSLANESPGETVSVNERRASHIWFYKDRETAERVAAAMNTLLEAQGAQKKAF